MGSDDALSLSFSIIFKKRHLPKKLMGDEHGKLIPVISSPIIYGRAPSEEKLSALIAELVLHESLKTLNRCTLISAVSDDGDLGILGNAERKHAEKALCVYTAIILLYPDGALIAVSLLNKEGSRSCMKSYAVVYGNLK